MTLLSRRQALGLLAGASAAGVVGKGGLGAQAAPAILTPEQDAFLNDLERRGIRYFWEQASAKTGQVRDRAMNEGSRESRRVTSTAATGFGLTALCIADKRGYLLPVEIRSRVHATLDYHAHKLAHEHGFFFHFNDIETGARKWNCEVSSVDTAILLCGVLTARAHFTGPGIESEIRDLATLIYERVDWQWMLDGGLIYSMGWMPESGFLNARWSTYSELMMIYLLGIGSPTFPADPKTWIAFARPYVNYAGFHYISDLAPLFTHQYSHAWFDFRGRHDRYTDYFANSILATRAHKAFCIDRGAPYSEDYWGVTASDTKLGYKAWGGPPLMGKVDGTVVPCAAAGSVAFLPADCLRVMMSLREKYPRSWGRYGFCDALHPDVGWYDPDVLGIDLGISVLMAENLRSSFVWDTFAKTPEVSKAMKIVGFVPDR